MLRFVSFYRFLGWSFVTGLCGAGILIASFYLYLTPNLPDVEQLRHTQLQIPLRIFSSDDKLIAEFGEKRRSPITIDQVPEKLSQAFIAAEDNRFYEHHGVDIKGLLRAVTQLATSGRIQSGGSTITMQVAKNFFLSREKTFTRKFNEILLALQIEQELSKDEILELYFNKIYLGNRAYGIEAASQVYYGKSVAKLTLAEMAMIAGLPKAPSRYNPIANPSRALIRRNWILDRMLDLGYIDPNQHAAAQETPITAVYHGSSPETEAPYLAEMARKELVDKYGEEAYSEGFNVYLTVNSVLQEAANKAVRKGLEDYDERHGYRGPESKILLDNPFSAESISAKINNMTNYGELVIAVVTGIKDNEATLFTQDYGEIILDYEGVKWARPFISVNRRGTTPKKISDVLQPGDIIRIKKTQDNKNWKLAQTPKVQGTLVSIAPSTGAIKALVGGYDFAQSKYNRALQAERQAGSNFKPFVYLAALEHGSTAATLINDAPIVFEDKNLEASWRPENSSGKFFGPTRLRTALYKSRNLVSIRLLKKTGVRTTRNFVSRFGFNSDALPNDLSLALGSAVMTPLQVATGYSTIANGGYESQPYFIEKIENSKGDIVFQATPTLTPNAIKELALSPPAEPIRTIADIDNNLQEPDVVQLDNIAFREGLSTDPSVLTPSYKEAKSIIDERTIYIMHSILKDVIIRGTGRRAQALRRSDLTGKTGTTNDQKDAWFSGFNTETQTTVWVGFDQPTTLGRREYGATAALPIWIDYMRVALANTPSANMKQPEGIVTVKINTETGALAKAGEKNTIFEIFRKENAPQPEHTPAGNQSVEQPSAVDDIITAEDIF
ncbi:penicillin-binding protein 1A [Alkalimarinus alittae]|uniref:Penicillin-binding protein 1A n=1 Tax=Alkalimarinus alittae TaxID=2961619 RepID=A0ABY6N0V1_9ALTE|nr:penicillin-binding protein 1A [Alkalimarinus alittae]UZE95642.1 penicillin-binding protein 1A [Alkalimarinus alittae]